MSRVNYWLFNFVETLLRMLPLPTRTGYCSLGHPGPDSPVILTCNYHLTVLRVKWALRGQDVHLLVANSRGINVWCAATGGLFTHHDVISILKTSGIEQRVNHRKVILPQLGATGLRAQDIHHATGWRVIWGPVYAKDLPAFLAQNFKTTREQRQVEFPWPARLEMAAAWAFPISLLGLLVSFIFWPSAWAAIVGLIWALSFLIFMTFPWYERWLNPRQPRLGFIVFDFGRGGIQLLLWLAMVAGFYFLGVVEAGWRWGLFGRWSLVSLVIILLISMDLMGSTPVFKSGLHADRLLSIELDEECCRGAAFCEQVCPRQCYEVDHNRHKATVPRKDLCVQCGACVVQCPFDALYFAGPDGRVVTPDTIRKYKLNLLGNRTVTAG